MSDHPRSRGVYRSCCSTSRRRRGSSPLARGLQLVLELGDQGRGIIPARAGFTSAAAPSTAGPRDHPRSRGVYPAAATERAPLGGSSPLARGLRVAHGLDVVSPGIIPARAGFTIPAYAGSKRPWDHPRSRGVYRSSVFPSPKRTGSSPLARGLRHARRVFRRRRGIIPARAGFTEFTVESTATGRDHPRSRGVYEGRGHGAHGVLRIIPARAGFTCRGLSPAGDVGDHPRSRGVYPASVQCGASTRGSSPLARGLRTEMNTKAAIPGIIPARAGFTWWWRWRPPGRRDHPRSRGVYAPATTGRRMTAGSSPLARGLPVHQGLAGHGDRIIPARAGFTCPPSIGRAHPPDHPRSRGVYPTLTSPHPRSTGSSPLARGLRNATSCYTHCARIIPARAGFTRMRPARALSPRDHPRSRGVYSFPSGWV